MKESFKKGEKLNSQQKERALSYTGSVTAGAPVQIIRLKRFVFYFRIF
jgi:hypothetical protein